MENLDFNIEHWQDKKCPPVNCRKKACECGLEKVFLSSALGDDSKDSPIAPKNGAYCNAIVVYEANSHVYIYSKEGIPTLVETGGSDVEDIIEQLEDQLAQEILDRQAADNTLQGEIDDLKNSPDVVDIVPTYAALQAYDTSKLGDNDIIRVLQDEQHDGDSTYYRWDSQTETWTYIGGISVVASIVFYADNSETGDTRHIYKDVALTEMASFQDILDANEKGQVILRKFISQTPERYGDVYLQRTSMRANSYYDFSLMFLGNFKYYNYFAAGTSATVYNYTESGVQGTLTAGTNITITGNTISATDTTYSDFTGATIQQAGTSGLVPAPTTSDPDKFLKGDGTWGTPADTTYTAGTNVQISAQNVISATDTTYSAFTGTDGVDPGTAGLVPAPATTDADKFLKSDGTWDTAGGGGDIVYSTKTTSNADDGGAVYIGGKNSSQVIYMDPTTTDNHRRYFWALPYNNSGTANTTVPGNESVNIAGDQSGGGSDNVTIGYRTTCSGEHNVNIGFQAGSALAYGSCVCIGDSAQCGQNYSIALGRGAQVSQGHTGAIALGAYSKSTRGGEVNVGTTGTYAGYNNTNYRVIGGVHDGQELHDAATVAQGNTLALAAPDSSTVGVLGQLWTDTTNMHTYQCTAISGSTYTWQMRW